MSQAVSSRQRRRLWQLGGALALAAVIVAAIVVAAGSGEDTPKLRKGESLPGQIEANARFAPLPQKGIEIGNPKAPLTLVEFVDLQCPFCQQYTLNVLPTLIASYVRTGKLKMEFRNVAFISEDSIRAAQMAAAAGLQNKLWQFIEIFYVNQGEEKSGYVTDEFLRKIGHAVKGLDVEKAMANRGVAAVTKQLSDAQTQWRSNGFAGTPSFLIGRTGGTLRPLSVQTLQLNEFTSQIDKLLAEK